MVFVRIIHELEGRKKTCKQTSEEITVQHVKFSREQIKLTPAKQEEEKMLEII
jgi:hypothetical protein